MYKKEFYFVILYNDNFQWLSVRGSRPTSFDVTFLQLVNYKYSKDSVLQLMVICGYCDYLKKDASEKVLEKPKLYIRTDLLC